MTHTQTTGDRDGLLGQVVDEFFEAAATGETPDISDYVRRYPEIADLLKVAIPAMRAAEDATRLESTSALHTPPAEKQLGDFRILRQLGRGGMGIVYEAEQISMKRRVALKVLPLAGLVDELKIQRFHNEVRAVAALDHPNIVSVYMVGEERGVHYFAMQLIRGRSLAQVITSLRQVRDKGEALTGESLSQIATIGQPEEELAVGSGETPTEPAAGSHDAVKPANLETVAQADDSTIPHATRREYFRSVTALGIQAATALQHAHDQGIIHRDIKPANLLLDNSAKLFVTDFGLARMEAEAGVTMSGDLLGTLRYMAPEQALAKRVAVDHRADLYSLAVTLYELLTLQSAYLAEDRQQLLKQIAFEEPTRPRRVDPQIPAELETIVLKAMSKDRDERYSSAQELADDLRRFLENRPIQAKPPTLPQIVSKWTRRNPAIAWASIVTLALVTIAFGISTVLVTKQWDIAVQASQETADQLKISTITRLAAESRALQDERPILSVLLAIEAVELSQQNNTTVLPMAHEALLNATQGLRSGRPLTGHGSAISALTFSPDWLVTWGAGKAHLWDLTARASWASPRVLGADGEKISSCALSEDGHWLVTGGSKLQRWDLTTRNPDLSPHDLAAGDVGVTCFGLSSDGRWLVAQGDDRTVRLWDLDTANPAASAVLSTQADLFHQVAVSPDGRWVAATKHQDLQDATTLIWDFHAEDKSAFPLVLKGHQDYIARLAISPDSRWLVTGSYDKTTRLWELESISATSSRVLLPPNDGPVQQLLITPDCQWLFTTADHNPGIRRWDLSAADPSLSPFALRGHKDDVRSLAVSRDGHWLVSGSSDGTARLWDLHAGDPSLAALVLRAHDSGVEAVAIHPSSRWVATAGADETALLWDLYGADPASSQFVLRGQEDDTFSKSAISSDGRWIATEIKDNAVQLWDMDAKEAATFSSVLRGPKAKIESLEISPDDHWLVAGSKDGRAQVWDLTSHDIPSSLKVFGGQEYLTDPSIPVLGKSVLSGRLAISLDSRLLALAGKDNKVRLWDLKGKDEIVLSRVLEGNKSPVESIVFSADGRWLVTGSQAGNGPTVRLWDLNAEDQQASPQVLSGHPYDAYSLAIDSNSRWLATIGTSDGSARLWDLKSGDPGRSPRVIPPPHKSSGIWRVAISPDARWLFTSRFDRTAQLWDLSEEAPTPHELRGHNGVQSVAISPDGHWLATGCRTNAYLWDLTAADPASTARVMRGHDEAIWSVRISADSRWLVTDASDGTIRRWNLDTQWLLNHAREVAGRELTDVERLHYGVSTLRQASAAAANRTD